MNSWKDENMIKGKIVYLRPIIKEDLKFLNEWKNDEETYKYLGGGFSPTSVDQQEKWMDAMIDTTGINKRFIISDSEHRPVGMIGLYDINWIHRVCEIGLYIGDKNSKGKGYGKEACLIIEKFALEYLNLRKIKLNVVSDNEHAINLWTSLGYQKVGEYIKERFIKGEYKNLTLMEKFIDKCRNKLSGGVLAALVYIKFIIHNLKYQKLKQWGGKYEYCHS